MEIVLDAAVFVAALTLIAASFIYIVNPRQGLELLKRLAAGIAGLFICGTLIGQAVHAEARWFFLIPVLSGAAYVFRRTAKANLKHPVGGKGGAERTRLP
jgi:hypothetical protein